MAPSLAAINSFTCHTDNLEETLLTDSWPALVAAEVEYVRCWDPPNWKQRA